MSRLRPPGMKRVTTAMRCEARAVWLRERGLAPTSGDRWANLSVELVDGSAALEYARQRWALEATREPPFDVELWAMPWVDVVLKAMRGHALFSSRPPGAEKLAAERGHMQRRREWCAGLLDQVARAIKRRGGTELPPALAAVKSATMVGGRALVMSEFLVAQGIWRAEVPVLDEARWERAVRLARTTPAP